MPMDKAHAEQRKHALGSTEIASILGVNPYQTGYDVWAEHTGKIERPDISDVPAVQAGVMFEGGILDWAGGELGEVVQYRDTLKMDTDLRLSAQLDGMIFSSQVPVEAKTAGLFGPLSQEWGEALTDHVPAHYLIQCQVQMILTESQVCHLAAFLGGVGFRMYRVDRSDLIVESIKEASVSFWDKYIVTDTPPDSVPSLSIMKLLPREEGKVIFLPPQVRLKVDAWLSLKERKKEIKAEIEEHVAELAMLLGDAEVGEFQDGSAYTYKMQTRRGFNAKALKAEMPDIAEKYKTESKYPVPRYRKAKK